MSGVGWGGKVASLIGNIYERKVVRGGGFGRNG